MLRKISGAVLGLLLATGGALAQSFPSKPLTMIIPFAAGGPTDVLGRVMAQRMSGILGQQVVVENVGGAGGMTGSKRVADAAPDGYTFVLGTVGTHAQSQTMYKKPLYNAATDSLRGADRRGPDRADHPQGPAGEQSQGIHRLREGKPEQDAIRLGRRGLSDPSRLRAAQLPNRGRHTCPLSRHRPRDAGPPGRPHRLSLRDRQHRQAADRWRNGETGRDHDQGAFESAAERADRPRAGARDLEAYTWNALFLPKGTPADVVKKLSDAALQAMKTRACESGSKD